MINKVQYYFFNAINNMKNFDPTNIKIDDKSYKNILIYCIRYVTIKDSKYVKVYSVHPLYLIFKKVNQYFEQINGNKYLTLVKKKTFIKNFGVKSEI